GATIPIVSANMNSVTGPRLSATLARRGGLGVLPQDLPLQELDAAIRWVKEQPVRWDAPIELSADATVAEALRVVPAIAAAVVVLRDAGGGEVGCVPAARRAPARPDARVGDLVLGGVTSLAADDLDGARAAFGLLVDADVDVALVRHHGRLVGSVTRRSALRSPIYAPALDASGRLRVAAAVGTNGDVAADARALAHAGVDVLVVDTAHVHQEG